MFFSEAIQWIERQAASVALPIAHARVRVGDHEQAQALTENARSATFRIRLKSGPTTLQTWFDDERHKNICGAYYG